MKPTTAITLPASFVVTLSHATEVTPTVGIEHEILTVAEVAKILKCKPSSIYNMTRRSRPTIRPPYSGSPATLWAAI